MRNTETARTIAVKGGATISATNSADYSSTVDSPIFGLALNEREITTGADVSNVAFTTGTLSISATDEGVFTADARFAQNITDGVLKATINDATITANSKNSDDESIVVSAVDNSEYQAVYINELSANVAESLLTSIIPVNADGVMVLNQTTKEVHADVIESALTTAAGAGDIDIIANRGGAMDATARVTVASTSLSLGGVIAENRVGYDAGALDNMSAVADLITSVFVAPSQSANSGDVRAQLTGDTETLSATGDITVTANESMNVNTTVSNVATVDDSGFGLNDGVGLSAGFVMSQTLRDVDLIAKIDGFDSASANGAVTVSAEDNANIYSNTLLTSESVVTDDGGVSVLSSELQSAFADHQTDSLPATYDFGDTVFVLKDYTHGGDAGLTYEFVGANATALTNPDFSDLDYWKPVTEQNLVSIVPNFAATDSASLGAAFVRNDVDASVTALVNDVTFTSVDSLAVSADANGVLHSTLDVNVQNAGGGAVMGGGSSFAAGGFIATNQLRGATDAAVTDASITVVNSDSDTDNSNVTVDALQNRTLKAINNNLIESGSQSIGVALAYNQVGYATSNFMSMAMDNLLGTDALMTQQDAYAKATIDGSIITGAGLNDVLVTANNTNDITAKLTNDTVSNASAMFASSSGFAMGFAFTSNLIASSVEAKIVLNNDDGNDLINASGEVKVSATNNASVVSDTELLSISNSSGSDGGLSLLDKVIDDIAGDYKFSSLAGSQTLNNGDLIRVASTHSAGGTPGVVYRYLGADNALIDLSAVNFAELDSALDAAFTGTVSLVTGRLVRVRYSCQWQSRSHL